MIIAVADHNLSNCEISPKKIFRGFNGIWTRSLCICVAVLYHLSYGDPYNGKQANLMSSSTRERNETWNEVNCELRKYKNGMKMWSLQLYRNLSNCEISPKKDFGASMGFKLAASACFSAVHNSPFSFFAHHIYACNFMHVYFSFAFSRLRKSISGY